MKGKEDEALFERLVDGDQEALRPLMERYGDALTLYVNGYVHDVDAAEDIMIEAFSRMLAKRPQMRRSGFKPYCTRRRATWRCATSTCATGS